MLGVDNFQGLVYIAAPSANTSLMPVLDALYFMVSCIAAFLVPTTSKPFQPREHNMYAWVRFSRCAINSVYWCPRVLLAVSSNCRLLYNIVKAP